MVRNKTADRRVLDEERTKHEVKWHRLFRNSLLLLGRPFVPLGLSLAALAGTTLVLQGPHLKITEAGTAILAKWGPLSVGLALGESVFVLHDAQVAPYVFGTAGLGLLSLGTWMSSRAAEHGHLFRMGESLSRVASIRANDNPPKEANRVVGFCHDELTLLLNDMKRLIVKANRSNRLWKWLAEKKLRRLSTVMDTTALTLEIENINAWRRARSAKSAGEESALQ